MIEMRLQAVVVDCHSDAVFSIETPVPGRADGVGGGSTQRPCDTHCFGEHAEGDGGQVPPGSSGWALPGCQRSVPAPAVATASSGWMSSTRPTPARHAAPATMRETSGVAPSVNGTASPASS